MASPSSTPSPYPLTAVREGYEFTTEAGEHYLLYFSDASGYFDLPEAADFAPHALMLGLKRLRTGKRPAHDPRIAATLLYYVEAPFNHSTRVITYVCDTSDKLQQQRSCLFNRLFAKHNDGRFIKLDIAVADSLYASLIYQQRNPFTAQIQQQVPLLNKMRPYLPQ